MVLENGRDGSSTGPVAVEQKRNREKDEGRQRSCITSGVIGLDIEDVFKKVEDGTTTTVRSVFSFNMKKIFSKGKRVHTRARKILNILQNFYIRSLLLYN